ncbi:unnamed protein product [Onchocerca ochengi]|uniref:Usp domain-containing protein n=1 Tax=Onchocerca ochengi TaxID=42157 RepID=A0A182EGY7_ONCOC|nr:unnamed protein product [Onchocerca ochengi]
MRGRSAIRFSVPRIRLFLQFVTGVLIISISITASLLSITLFLLRGHFSYSWRNLRDSKNSGDDFSSERRTTRAINDTMPRVGILTCDRMLEGAKLVAELIRIEDSCITIVLFYLMPCEKYRRRRRSVEGSSRYSSVSSSVSAAVQLRRRFRQQERQFNKSNNSGDAEKERQSQKESMTMY